MTKNRRTVPILAALAVTTSLFLPNAGALASDDPTDGGEVGVERYSVACLAGPPVTIEVAPLTGRVELEFESEGCHCFGSAEDAASWLQGEAQRMLTGDTDDMGMLFSGIDRMVAEPDPGKEVEVAAYCFTAEQVDSYLISLKPAETVPRDR